MAGWDRGLCGRCRCWLLVAAFGSSIALSSGTAQAEDAGEASKDILELADYYESQDRIWQARTRVAELLRSDPHNLAAQRWYIRSWQRVDEASRVEQQYRTWLAEEPDSEFRRLCLALAVAAARGFSRGWGEKQCAEVSDLLEPLPGDPNRRFLALFTLDRSYELGDCEGDSDTGQEQMRALLESSSEARRQFLRPPQDMLYPHNRPFDRGWLELLREEYTDEPSKVAAATTLWDEEASEGAGEVLSEKDLSSARKHAVAAARRAMRSKQLSKVSAAHSVLRAAGHKKATATAAKLLARLDPLWRAPGEVSALLQGQDAMQAKVRNAVRQFDPSRRLEALDALSDGIPTTGDARNALLEARARVLTELGRSNEAIDAYRELHELTPDSPGNANTFAWEAALAGIQLDAALVAVDRAIQRLRSESWLPPENRNWQNNLEEWSRGQGRTEGAYLDTRGWILYKLERYEEAEDALRAALRLHQSSELHLHMGLICAQLGNQAAAIWHLAEGLPAEGPGRNEVEREGLAVFRELFESAGFWHPGGADGYLLLAATDRQRGRKDRGGQQQSNKASEPDSRFAPGTPFPDLAYQVGDEEHTLSELGGIVLVDMWATWCGPCVEGLPHLSEIAKQYQGRGVRTLALSVDDEQEDAEDFFDAEDQPAFERGWTGDQAMDRIGIEGIPAAFILDDSLAIAGHVFGYSDGDRRIEEILDALLGEPR